MKSSFTLVLCLLTLSLIFSCKKDNNSDTNPAASGTAPIFEAKINGVLWKASNCYYMQMLSGNMLGGTRPDTTIEFDGNFAGTGTCTLSGKSAGGFYCKTSSSDPVYYYYIITNGATLTLTKCDMNNKIVSGSFVLTGANSAHDTIRITEGKFENVPFTH